MKKATVVTILVLLMRLARAEPSAIDPSIPEVTRMYEEDQSDRRPAEGAQLDWKVVGPRDQKRRARVMELYASGSLHTGRDYVHAAMILQHGDKPEDFLLCHELCVAAIFKSTATDSDWVGMAKWLAAASEDRFLVSIGRSQRFGTQFYNNGQGTPWKLRPIEEGVSDELRKIWEVPSLEKAKQREIEMNRGSH